MKGLIPGILIAARLETDNRNDYYAVNEVIGCFEVSVPDYQVRYIPQQGERGVASTHFVAAGKTR